MADYQPGILSAAPLTGRTHSARRCAALALVLCAERWATAASLYRAVEVVPRDRREPDWKDRFTLADFTAALALLVERGWAEHRVTGATGYYRINPPLV